MAEKKASHGQGRFECTRCGVLCFGEPVLSGPRRAVCQKCVNQARSKRRRQLREANRRLRAREREERGGQQHRVCEMCGERKFIFDFRKVGRGRRHRCEACEARERRGGAFENP